MGDRLDQLRRAVQRWARSLIVAGLASLPAAAAAQPAPAGVSQLLQPGSRAAWCTGSDPFLSPLADETGWWGTLGHGARRATIEARARVPLSAGATHDKGSLRASEAAWGVTWDGRFGRRHWIVAGRVANPRWEGALRQGAARFGLEGAATRADLGLRLADALPGLTLQLTLPAWQDREMRRCVRAGLRYAPAAFVAVQANVGRGRTPETFEAGYADAVWSASLNVASLDRRIESEILLPAHVALEGALWRSDYSQDESRSVEPVYHAAPSGRAELSQLGVRWGRQAGWRAAARWTRGELDGRADASWGGQRFGQLNYARADVEAGLAGLQVPLARRTRALVEYEWGRVRGVGRANFETWPFTSTVVDLLGQRRIAKAEGELVWCRAHFGFERAAGKASRWGAGLAWFDLRPDLEIQSWSPAFLVFGRRDVRVDTLPWRRVQLLGLVAGARLRHGSLGVDAQVQQLVPVHVDATPSTAVAPGEGSGGAKPRHGRRWPNGTSLVLALIYRL